MKNLLIVFPGGCGGNHLANLISLNDKFTPRFKSNDYHNDLLNQYKQKCFQNLVKNTGELYESPSGINAHFAEHHHLDQFHDTNKFQELLNTPTINILPGHEHDFEQLEMKGSLISKVPDSFWIVLTYPKVNTIAYNRIKLYKFTPRPDRYTYPYYVSYQNYHKGWPVADESNSLLFETENFISNNGCDYIKNKLSKINIELHDLAYEIHSLWYNKLIEVLTLYDAMPTKYFNEYGDLN